MKTIDELKQALAEVKEEVRSLNKEGKVEDAEKKLEEVRALNKQIEIQMEIDKQEEEEVEEKIIKTETRDIKKNEIEVRDAFFKAISGKPLNVEERALVQTGDNTTGGFLVPNDVQNQINVLKRQYLSAKDLLNVVTVQTPSGSFVVEDSGSLTMLVNFDEDNTGLAEQNPIFRNVEYTIDNYGAVTPISRSFLQDETANFMNYLSGLFARKAVRTENAEIFTELRVGKTAVPVAGLGDLKRVVNIDLDPSLKAISVIAMNQDAYNYLDQLEDGMGRPLLQPNPSQATDYLMLGLPVYVFSNVEMPTVGELAPMFVGALSAGCTFFDRDVYEVAVSSEAGFRQNQVVARVVERFDVKQTDADSYILAEIDVVADPAV
jgi:HK97 family phage major capsid protein